MRIKPILKRILPVFVLRLWHSLRGWKTIPRKRIVVFTWESVCNRKIATMKDKGVLTVLFLPANLGMWKYEFLFKKMMEHPRFRPLILPSPNTSLGKDEQEREIEKMKKSFSEKGFPVIDRQNAKDINPDLVFTTLGYDSFGRYKLKDFPNALGCYAPYFSFPSFSSKWPMDDPLQNKMWRIFTQNKATYERRVVAMTNKGKNVRITGYLNADHYIRTKDVPFTFPWKLKNPELKKVIYAPHWSIEDSSNPYSTFLSMGEVMLDIAEKYADKVQWCFKPHPWLFKEVKKLWGEEKALAYFKRWEELENATHHTEEYISLFMTSDAMIHDCASFRYEYFYTKKPVMYLIQGGKNLGNDIALQAIEAHYKGRSREDIERFIEETVLGGNDPKFEERERFLKEYLLPPNNQSVAQNIIDEIERGLGWKK